MERITENLVRCPSCKGGYCSVNRDEKDFFTCKVCGERYPIRDGFADLVPELHLRKTVAQFFMESPAIVNIYESRLWRKSIAAAMILGISFNKEAKLISGAANIADADSVLDLACGPGIYTRAFARTMGKGRVVGLDLSAPMLRWGASRAKKQGLDNVVYVRASALDLPFEEESFEAVNCCGALHLFPDPDKALEEISRVLAPGGCFTVAAVRRGHGLLGAVREKYTRSMGFRGFTSDELSQTLERKGFSGIHCHHDARRWIIMSAVKQ
ncbi:Methyltransferase domain-containing protein [Desulfatibacillum alkenivorans DSM 16219]|jgi:SAM-dependent methyltransferase|uniref:Methyltransferase domain-containing protein n=1 Tax=Desulfatibacillum alkenivorans DSM 16219 TaxID=1121393 RepID=A0A1M6W0P8_9BACT|nr:methyltransferase domain-containing protein [Desulfatibacillum alkenivorans]SHK87198.1 Methyltransferase domain-containing protein [Desulfatibacillum alkenivorans DSM 16219]